MRSILAVLALGGHSKGPGQGGEAGPHRPGPAGVVQEPPRPPYPVTPDPIPHPLQPPAGTSGARSAGYGVSPGSWVLPRGTPLYYPPWYTHPVYPPWYTRPAPPFCASCTPRHGTTGTCTYDRFELVQGEPRGLEYTKVSGSQTGYTRG